MYLKIVNKKNVIIFNVWNKLLYIQELYAYLDNSISINSLPIQINFVVLIKKKIWTIWIKLEMKIINVMMKKAAPLKKIVVLINAEMLIIIRLVPLILDY